MSCAGFSGLARRWFRLEISGAAIASRLAPTGICVVHKTNVGASLLAMASVKTPHYQKWNFTRKLVTF